MLLCSSPITSVLLLVQVNVILAERCCFLLLLDLECLALAPESLMWKRRNVTAREDDRDAARVEQVERVLASHSRRRSGAVFNEWQFA